MQFDPQAFQFVSALTGWLLVVGVFGALIVGLALLQVIWQHGFGRVGRFFDEIVNVAQELSTISIQRVLALTQLTFREAVRRRSLAVFVVFALLYMFAGWFLTGSSLRPSEEVNAYTSFALKTIGWLSFPVVLLLSCWGIPEDIRLRSIHTVTTKPVRRIEIVLGRILGYSIMATLIVGLMGVFGLLWVNRQVSDAAQSELTCRRPIFGELQFLDRDGQPARFGVNVGDTWEFRSYVEGATKARASWTFENVTPASLNANGGLRLESRFQAFRSHKGQMDRPLMFQYILYNPVTKRELPLKLVRIDEFRNNVDYVMPNPVELVHNSEADGYQAPAPTEKSPNLFRDFVTEDGKLTVQVACIDPGQYIGMARPDFFIRLPDAPYAVGFFKAVLGIELFVLLVVVLGVTASTFVKGPLATLLTFVMIAVGYGGQSMLGHFRKAFLNLQQTGEAQFEGGGALESIYRLVNHMNMTTDVPTGATFRVIKAIDTVGIDFVGRASYIIPDVNIYELSGYVAKGFDVPWNTQLAAGLAMTIGYLIPCVILGYFALRTRELEAK